MFSIRRIQKGRRGFTLIELLVVIAIIAFLLGLIGIVAMRARDKAKVSRAKGLVKRIHLAMDSYRAINREYPPTGSTTLSNCELNRKWLTDWDATVVFNKDDYDPTDDNFFVDPWGRRPERNQNHDSYAEHRIRYRKVSPERMLIWSVGPDGIDQIGTDAQKRERGRDIFIGKDSSGKDIFSDDISNVEADF